MSSRRVRRNKSRRKRYTKGKQRKPVAPPVSHRLHALREKLWGVAAIVSCVQRVSDLVFTPENRDPDIPTTMETVDEMIGEITTSLAAIIDELGGPPDSEDAE